MQARVFKWLTASNMKRLMGDWFAEHAAIKVCSVSQSSTAAYEMKRRVCRG